MALVNSLRRTRGTSCTSLQGLTRTPDRLFLPVQNCSELIAQERLDAELGCRPSDRVVIGDDDPLPSEEPVVSLADPVERARDEHRVGVAPVGVEVHQRRVVGRARISAEYAELRADMDELLAAREHPSEKDALDLQQALWNSGFVRAAAAFDCLIAAYAVANDAVILNSDHDFGYLQLATNGTVHQEYIDA